MQTETMKQQQTVTGIMLTLQTPLVKPAHGRDRQRVLGLPHEL